MISSNKSFIASLLLAALWIAKWKGAITWPWPVVVLISILCLGIFARLAMVSPRALKVEASQAFNQASRQQLRCLAFPLPPHWKWEKIQSGAFRVYMAELGDLAWINVDADWLWKTDIDSVEAYTEYAVQFVQRTLKARLVRNEVTERWGTQAHEFEFTGTHSTGWKITVPYHGSEYGLQVSARFARTYPAAKALFEEFLKRTELKPPNLEQHSAFQGTFSIGLPAGFRNSEDTADSAVWTALDGREMKVAVRRLRLPPEVPLTADLLQPLAAERPNPSEPFSSTRFSMKDVGISGFQSYQATATGASGRDWFIAALELVTGGRYLFIFDAQTITPAQTFYLEHFRYAQISMEIIASIVEQPDFT